MTTRSCSVAWGLLLTLFALPSVAQDPAPPAESPAENQPAQPDEPKPRGQFPEPLEQATSNLRDIEKTGYVSILGVEDRALDRRGERGFVWSIKTLKPITSRHLKAILARFRDVRFYVQQENGLVEVHSALLQYSNRVNSGAVNGIVYGRDDQFELWFALSETERRRLAQKQVDRVVFRRLKR